MAYGQQFGPVAGYQPYGGYQPNSYMERLQAMTQPQVPTFQIMRVNGAAGADALPMGPRSDILALDQSRTDMLLAWYIQTDDAGYKTKTPYVLTPYTPEQPQMSDFEARLARLEEIVNGKPVDGQPAPQHSGKRSGKSAADGE